MTRTHALVWQHHHGDVNPRARGWSAVFIAVKLTERDTILPHTTLHHDTLFHREH